METLLVLLRVAIGLRFLHPGILMLAMPTWSAKDFLVNQKGWFAPLFRPLAGNAWVDWLNKLGLTAVGLSLTFGFLTNVGIWAGIIMLLLYYLAQFPPKNGWISEHPIEIIALLLLLALGAGEIFSLDALLR